MGNIGGWELFWVVLIVLVLFGAKRIPDFMRSIAQGMKEFKKTMKDIDDGSDTKSPQNKSEDKKG